MEKSADWKSWGRRFKAHAKDNGFNLAKVAEGVGVAESTVRSWTNGTRPIQLADFFACCEAANADPATVLFGAPVLTDAYKERLSKRLASALEADPTANPDYGTLVTKIRKSVRKRS